MALAACCCECRGPRARARAHASHLSLSLTFFLPLAHSVSSLPIILHPVIAFGMLTGMSNSTILSIVMAGRTIKYLVMGWVTANAPSALRFFGIKGDLLEYATNATAKNKAFVA